MNKLPRIIVSALMVATVVLSAPPAQAIDEIPTPDPNPELTACLEREGWATREAQRWEAKAGVYEELYESYLASHERLATIAHDWQLRAFEQREVIDRLRRMADRRAATIQRLRAKVRALR